MTKPNKMPSQEVALLVTGFSALLIVQLFYQRPPFDDEHDYLGNVAILHQYGFGQYYLQHLIGSAGPLYSMVHFLFEPLTRLQAPYVRWVNMGFLAAVIMIVYRLIRLCNQQPGLFSLYMMAIPMVYVIAGQALTEMPAMFFFCLAVYIVIKNSLAPERGIVLSMVLAGCFMSLAIIGRQPYLLTLAAFPILFIKQKSLKKSILPLAVLLSFSLALPCYVFAAWKGLVPTIESQLYIDIAQAGVSYRPDFFLLCSFYFAVSMVLIAPSFYKILPGKKTLPYLGICFILITVANFIFQWITLLPVRWLFEKILTLPVQVDLISSICGSAVIFFSLYFWTCMYYNSKKLTSAKPAIFFAATLFLIAFACVKITWGFSSRYAGQAAPLVVLLASFFYSASAFNGVRIIAGILTGLISIISYFHNT